MVERVITRGENMELTIKGEAKEIAALVVEIQARRPMGLKFADTSSEAAKAVARAIHDMPRENVN